MGGDILGRGPPDVRAPVDVIDQLREHSHTMWPADHFRMHGQDKVPTFFIQTVKLPDQIANTLFGSAICHHVAVFIAEMRPVIQDPLHRQFQHAMIPPLRST